MHVLASQDWSRTFEQHGQRSRLVLADRQEMLRAGLDCADVPLVIQRLHHGPHIAGYLVVSGAALSVGDLKMLESAAAFVAARMVHLECRERAEQKDEEARLLGQMAEKCLTAHSVEELLPLALEAAMCSLRARRGSILLAEEQGRITAQRPAGRPRADLGHASRSCAPTPFPTRSFSTGARCWSRTPAASPG